MIRPVTRALLLTFPLIAACKGSPSGDSDGPIIEEPDCEDDGGCEVWQICEQQECISGDRNNSVAEAVPILWENSVGGILQNDGDADYYSFNAEGGEFIRVTTAHVPEENEEMDTIVSLYNPSGQLHHREDNHAVGRVNTYDTVLYAYVPTAGTWTLVVEDVNGVGDYDHAYELTLGETGSHTRESDSSDDPSMDLDISGANTIWAIGVALEEVGDADWIQLNLPYDDCPVYIQGSTYVNGTDAVATAELYTADGQILLRKEGVGSDGYGAYFEVDGGTALLSVSDSLNGGGENYWTFVYVQVDDRGYSWPQESEPNDQYSTANALNTEWDTNEWGNYGSALVWGTFDIIADEDWFYVDVDEGYYLTVRGSADALGSFLDAAIEIYTPDGDLLASETSGSDTFPDVYNLGPLSAGRYTMRVTNEEPDLSGPQYFYRVSLSQSDYELAED